MHHALVRSILAGLWLLGLLASPLAQPLVARADAGFTVQSGPGHWFAGYPTGRMAVAQTTFLPSVGILGAADPTIDWGDGTVDTLTSDAISCDYRDVTHVLAFCLLFGNHQWAFPGTYTITATYATGLEFSYSTSWQMTTVWPTDIRPTLTNIYPSPGQNFNGTVATFIDTSTDDPASLFSATVNWGDGTPPTVGTVTGGMAYFSVGGSHQYASPGTYGLDVKVTYGGSAADVYSTAHVAVPASVQINDTDPNITYVGEAWTYSQHRGYGDFQDDEHFTTANGDSLSYTFTGTGISAIGEQNAVDGSAAIYVDGTLQGHVSTAAATRHVQHTLYSIDGLTDSPHQLRVVKLSGEYLEIDSLIVRTAGTTVNDTDKRISYAGSGWYYSSNRTFVPGVGDYQTDVHATTANGDSFSFTFNGSGIAYIAEEGAYYGNVDVYLDGVFKQTVGSYVAGAANTSPQVIYRVNGLSAGQHTLKVAKRDGTWMTIDALTVQP